MADSTVAVKSDGQLIAELEAEISQLIANCREAKAHRAADFLAANREITLGVALVARKEPKKRQMPSPFIYSMQ